MARMRDVGGKGRRGAGLRREEITFLFRSGCVSRSDNEKRARKTGRKVDERRKNLEAVRW